MPASLPLRAGLALAATLSTAFAADLLPDTPKQCASCAAWNKPQQPFRLFGDSWFVGTEGLSSVLIDSGDGLVLLDGGLPESAPLIAANIRQLGFRLEDIRYIATSHAHYDHAGGVAALARASGAQVLASARSAEALRAGDVPADDPQADFGSKANSFPKVENIRIVADGEALKLGTLVLTAHYTPGHTPGATSWSWQSCQERTCRSLVYVDSLNPVSDEVFRFSGGNGRPSIADAFAHSIGKVEKLPCDLLVSVHPDNTQMAEKLAARAAGTQPDPLLDAGACRRYAARAREKLAARLAEEKAAAKP
jgi:metallo-beta-lactamase class B